MKLSIHLRYTMMLISQEARLKRRNHFHPPAWQKGATDEECRKVWEKCRATGISHAAMSRLTGKEPLGSVIQFLNMHTL